MTVMQFAVKMEEKLSANDHKSGWEGMSYKMLINRMRQEIKELERAIKLKLPAKEIQYECADVANFAMMIADNIETEDDGP